MGIHSERPAVQNDTRKAPLKYKINKILAKIYGMIFKEGIEYKALNSEESLKYLLETEKSFVRLADGEAKLMLGGDWPTQWGSKELSDGLWKIFDEYKEDSDYVIGVGNSYLTQSVSELKKQGLHRIWRNPRYCMRKYLIRKPLKVFIESNMFRVGPEQIPLKNIEKLWEKKKDIIIVANKKQYEDWFNDKYSDKRTFFIQVPEKNAFKEKNRVKGDIYSIIEKNNLGNDLAIMISMGPGGKVLIHEIVKERRYYCMDLGNFFYMRQDEDE
jgi:hypothetical protein